MKQGLKHKVCMGILLGGAAISLASPLQAASNPVFLVTAIQKAPAVVYPGQVVTATYAIKNNPKNPNTLYANGIVELPRGIKVIGGSCAKPAFTLTSGQACTVQLQITADRLLGNVKGGPKVCNSLKYPVRCSSPPKNQVLHIIKSKNPPPISTTTLTISPAKLVFEPSGSSKTVTITNTGPVAATDVKVKTAPGLGVTITGKCASPLSFKAPNNTCELTVTPSSQEGTTSAIIAGENTNEVKLDVTSAPLTTLSVTVLTSPAIIGVNTPGAGVDISIENTGGTIAYNVIDTLPTEWHGVQASSSCGDIAPGPANACTLTFSATQPNLADVIGFSADNTSTTVPSADIAFRYGGGLAFSISGTSPNARAKVVAETDQGTNVVWGDNGVTGAKDPTHGQNLSVVPGSSNPDNMGTNGPGNTYLIIDVLANAPAANLCANYNGDGHTDWYLPAICDLSAVTNVGFNCSSENIDQNLKQLGFGTILNTYYWSSDESTLNDTLDATAMDFNAGNSTALPRVADLYVRCIREIIY